MTERVIKLRSIGENGAMEAQEQDLNYERHRAIKEVTCDTEEFHFNTAIARMMELLNAMYKYDGEVENKNVTFLEETLADLIRLLAPFAPHFAEEMWEILGCEYSIFNQSWPKWNPDALIKDEVEIAVQINGKVRSKLMVPSNADNKEIEQILMGNDEVQQLLKEKRVLKVIVVKGRLVNIVVK